MQHIIWVFVFKCGQKTNSSKLQWAFPPFSTILCCFSLSGENYVIAPTRHQVLSGVEPVTAEIGGLKKENYGG